MVPASASADVVVDRDEFSTTTRLADGKLKTSVSSQPVNFKDGGEWKQIDTTLKPGASGALEATAVDGETEIPSSLSSPIVLEHDGRKVTVRLIGASGGRDAVKDAGAEFDDALTAVDASYVATPRGVKETLKLASAAAPDVFSYDVRGGSSWTAAVDGRGDVVLKDGAGTERYRIAAPLAWDGAQDPAFTNDLELKVSKVSDGRWTVTLTPDAAWLSDPARVYPVSIDPDFSWSDGTTHFRGAQDCYLSGNTQANYTFCAQTYLQTGYFNRPYKSIFKFDIASAIPTGATVNAATFKAYAPPQGAHYAASHSLTAITSDWDSTATWNNRKTGTPWATPGGDISTDPALKSTSTSVQANSTWYSWNAPLAAVQGWVNGTLPNNGLLLATEPGAPSNNAYVWASTEASTSSSFPATSNEWPTLDVTWSAPSSADITPPTPPFNLSLDPIDPQDEVAFLTFLHGEDSPGTNGAPASGVVRTEYRYSRNGAAPTGWFDIHPSVESLPVYELEDGESVTFDLRTVDAAGNTSTVASKTEIVRELASDWVAPAAAEQFAERFGGTQAAAQTWLAAQHRGRNLSSLLESSGASLAYSGIWFNNSQRKIHVAVTDSSALQTVAQKVDEALVTGWVVTHVVAWTSEELADASKTAQEALASEISDGQVQVYPDVERQAVIYELAANPSSATTAAVASSRSASTPPTALDQSDWATLRGADDKCESKPLDDLTWPDNAEGHNWAYCGGPLRAGTTISTAFEDNSLSDTPCTGGFLALTPAGEPLMLTAGHCLDLSGPPEWGPLENHTARIADHSGELKAIPLGKPWKKYHVDGEWDIGAISITNPTFKYDVRPWVWVHDGDDTKNDWQYQIEDVDTVEKGDWVCMSGASSGLTNCGQVRQTKIDKNHVAMADYCRQGGDSGSPVYADHTAFGIHVRGQTKVEIGGGVDCRGWFTGALSAETKLNAEIATPDRLREATWDGGYYGRVYWCGGPTSPC